MHSQLTKQQVTILHTDHVLAAQKGLALHGLTQAGGNVQLSWQCFLLRSVSLEVGEKGKRIWEHSTAPFGFLGHLQRLLGFRHHSAAIMVLSMKCCRYFSSSVPTQVSNHLQDTELGNRRHKSNQNIWQCKLALGFTSICLIFLCCHSKNTAKEEWREGGVAVKPPFRSSSSTTNSLSNNLRGDRWNQAVFDTTKQPAMHDQMGSFVCVICGFDFQVLFCRFVFSLLIIVTIHM